MSDSTASPLGSTPVAPGSKKPIKVLIACDTFAPDVNGAAKFAERLAAGLTSRGHEVQVFAPAASAKHGTWTEEHEGQTFLVHRIKSWRWYPHDWLRYALPWLIHAESRRILDTFKPDVVHFQSHINIGRGVTIEAAKRGIRIIGTNHFMPENMLEFTLIPKSMHERLIKMAWKAARRTFGRAEAVTTPTVRAAEFLEKYTGLEGVLAISCGIDAHNYSPSFEPRTENRILFVGRVTSEKQIDVLLHAVTLLAPELDTQVEIVGGGDQKRNLEHLAQSLGISNRVVFRGYVTDEELRAAYTRATLFAMPSIAELQSIATMEAMASGLPIVAANAMALPHLVHDGQNGFLFEPGSAQDLADKLTRVLTAGPEALDALKHESLRLIGAHDINRTLDTFESLYRGEPVVDTITSDAAARSTE
ncbi:glycosyltransferase family 4 protein [Cryobacterium sp. MDB2-10]|nr:glycosyltransferase family 4 protein [Cryobacterium sp. MDB2-A-1]TFC11751.1 glycosyltransferase family 4 protein [Cryobacterium sp. MDB2-33-2]TFC15445.1 glycosyltransferase family 4 protein [Cryobacterium sp. MDB2-A-2]TFC20141.1 glycosyltransferase family 4 protein [Cryobacterium sp. MDB2-10]